MRTIIHILFLNLLICFAASAQQLRFKHLTSEDGLSTVCVRCIMQDDKGFMWFGTQDGLNKYNGFEFKVFKNDPTDTSSLGGSDVLCLNQLRSNLMLVGTDNGLRFFNPITNKFQRLQKPDSRLASKINTCFVLDSVNALVGTAQGLFLVDVKTRLVLRSLYEEETDVRCIQKFNGTLFIGTAEKGLWQLDSDLKPKRFYLGDQKGGVKYIPVDIGSANCMQEYNGNLYIGTYGQGVYVLNQSLQLTGNSLFFADFNPNTNYITDLKIKNDKVYVATEHGLVVHNLITNQTSYFERRETSTALNANACTSIYVDAENNCWIGTQLGGVNIAFSRALKFPISNYNYETKFHDVFSFSESKPGHLIIGGVKNFHELNLQTGQITDHSDFLNLGTVLSIARESETIFWVGTWGNGLFRYDLKTKKAKNFLDKNLGGTIVNLKIEGDFVYAGSIGDGLFKINTKTAETIRFAEKEGLPNLTINTIFKDSKGRVWLGTNEGGLVKMTGFDKAGKLPIEKIYKTTGKAGQIASNVIFAINEDKKGNVWVTTSTGLSKLKDDGTFVNYYEKHGLANAYLYSLLKDSLGNFWMSSNSGITRFDPMQPEDNLVFKNFSVKDGLVNAEFSMGAAYLSSKGQIYFGGARGFNGFNPASIKNNLNPPAIYVIGYKRGGKNVETDSIIEYKKHLNLSWRENYFQFELVALDYTDPAKNKFSYMLEGYDTEWSEPTTVRYVSYTELPGGEYTFKVKAANNDGTWNETPYEIKITVVPPFWKTKTFYVLCILVGLGGMIGYTQYRTRAIKKVNKILEAKVEERTKELHEKNLDITASIQYAKRIQEAILPSKDHIFSKLKKIFILYRPKDIVSGDFYWFAEKNGVKIFAVVDCTGHGVPGAFMSMIGHNLLNQIVLENSVTEPGEILNHLHRGIQAALRQGNNEISTNDGMDVSMLTISSTNGQAKWAGANRPLVLINTAKEFSRLEGDKFPVGGAQAHVDRVFTTKAVEAMPGTMAYMFSDGYADQFGGEKGKKFMVKRLHEILVTISHKPASEQKDELEKQIVDWMKGQHEQVDDVLLVGIEL